MDRTRLAVQAGGWTALMLITATLACNAGAATPQPATPAPTIAPPTVQPASQEDKPDPNSAGEAAKGADTNKGADQAGAPQASTQAAFTIRNDLGEPVCYVYISPITADTWGSDWLGDAEIIDVGGQRAFSVDAGQWDVMVADCNNNELASVYSYVISGPTSWQPGQSAVASAPATASNSGISLDLVNDTDTTICWVYLSPSTSDSWGGDWLGSSVIEPGQVFTFTLNAGTWDMTAEDCTSATLDTQYGVNVNGPLTWTLSGTTGGNEPLCGDGFCGDFENSGNCPQDCGNASEPLCGDGFCGDFENGGNCPADCYDVDFCGDGICAAWERNNICVADCGYEGGLCGNGVCGDFENSGNCPADCGYSSDCGNGICDMMESYDTCPTDCP